MNTLLKTFAFVGLSSLAVLPGFAGTVSLTNTLGDTLVDSQNTPLTSLFKFELGAFGNSFTPTSSNTDLWLQNWKPFALAQDSNSTWVSSFSAFSASAVFQSNGQSDAGLLDAFGNTPTFATNEVAYLWVFDDQSLTATREWALLTSPSWRFPDPNSLDPNAGSFSLADGTTPPVLGSFTPVYTTTPDLTSRLQTASVVPEPSSLMLLAVAGILVRFRRSGRLSA